MNPDGQDFYKPTGGTATQDVPSPSAAAGSRKPPTDTAFSWTASEYIEHNRSAAWYLILLFGTALLAAGIYFLTKEYFATGVIALLGIIVAIYSRQKPNQVTYELSPTGLRIGEKLYPYNLFRSFALVREGLLTSIHLSPLKRFMPPISVYYDPADEEKITDIISEHLPYEEAEPDRIDRLTRKLRF